MTTGAKEACDFAAVLVEAQVVIRAIVKMATLAIVDGELETLADALVCAERMLPGAAAALEGVEMAIR